MSAFIVGTTVLATLLERESTSYCSYFDIKCEAMPCILGFWILGEWNDTLYYLALIMMQCLNFFAVSLERFNVNFSTGINNRCCKTEPSIAQIAQYRRSADSSSTVAITLVI